MRYWILLFLLCLSIPNFAQEESCDLSPRLIVGEQARILPDFEVNIRPVAGTSQARIGSLTGGLHVTVLAGATCLEGFQWWQVDYGTGTGWVAEGSAGEYYLEPRGELLWIEGDDGELDPHIRTASGFIEPQGCMRPPDDYTIVTLGYATLNTRTLFMLDNAQLIYDLNGGEWADFRTLLTQGSYNAGVVAASFGTHDGGGAVDIAVRNSDYVIMEDDIMPMLEALRIAGFAAWLRDTGELYENSPIHIHAIAIGDIEASEIAQQQVSGDFGYFAGFNGLPPEEGQAPHPDIYGAPILCEWMTELDFIQAQN